MNNYRSTNKKRLSNRYVLFWILGLSATAPLLSIPIAGRLLSLYTMMLFFVFVLLLFEPPKSTRIYPKTSLDFKYYLWSLISILSSLFGLLYFFPDEEWMITSVSYVPKIVLYLLLFLLIRKSSKKDECCSAICYGLLFGFIINICWAIFDAFVFYILGYSITNELFAFYIAASDIRMGLISLTIGNTIRSCGLNIDPANIGLFAPIVALYGLNSRRYILYGLSVLSILASLSHTAFVGVILVSFYYFFFVKKNWIVSILGLTVVAFAVVTILSVVEFDALSQMEEAFIERTENKSDGAELDGARGNYWTNFIPVAIKHPSSLIIGTGYFTASYPYLANHLVEHEYAPYDPEQTYFSTYFDIGLIGLFFFLSMLFGIYKRSKILQIYKNECMIINSCIVGFAIAALGYHYTIYSVEMLIIIIGIIICNGENFKQKII